MFGWFKKKENLKWTSYVLTLDPSFDPTTGMQILIEKSNSLGLEGKRITNVARKSRPFMPYDEIWFEGVTK